MDFLGTPIIGLCPDLFFFFSGEVGEVVGNLENAGRTSTGKT